ncbi:MAG: efflux RND transporter periplasmic adaptor subunit [Proteobacteria bacterium]|nr:efflux RND transporter periplasmic adaptor subunit [Pseudomonadota bacterium]HQR03855.1 efflux RND transporter periplasmic adaptor subunit [Rhodocyclaceae bacterium]
MNLRLLPLFGAILILSACGRNEGPAPDPVRPALVQKVMAGSGAGLNVFSGEVRARHEADLGFRIGGKVIRREVDVGATVQAGQALAQLDPADALLEARRADAQRTLSEADLRRYRDLHNKGFFSAAALEAKETTFKAADAQAGLARNAASYATLRADKAGIITAVSAEPGQVVAAGQPVVRLARDDEREVQISIPESREGELRHARTFAVRLWSAPDKTYTGRLRELAPAADAATRTFTARIAVPDADAGLRLGMTATVAISDSADRGVVVPLSAILGQGEQATVWVLDPRQNTVSSRPVRITRYSETGAQVTAGLKEGETVVVAGVHKLLAGQKVKPVFTGSAAP